MIDFTAPSTIRDGWTRDTDNDDTDKRDRADIELREYILNEQRVMVKRYEANREMVKRERRIA